MHSGLRWQKWAVYKRLTAKESFAYALDDYIYQNMLRDIDVRHLNYQKKSKTAEGLMWLSVAETYRHQEEKQINGTIKALYKALNRKNYEDVHLLWLPSDEAELIIPGYEPVVRSSNTFIIDVLSRTDSQRGHTEIENFYRMLSKDLKYVGTITPTILSVEVYGYIAVVRTMEVIGTGNYLRVAKKKTGRPPSSLKVHFRLYYPHFKVTCVNRTLPLRSHQSDCSLP